jgi:phage-related protein
MKPVRFLGDSLKAIREFGDDAKRDAGFQLDRVQRGLDPTDFKPMTTVGKGVREIRMRDEAGIYRVMYTAQLADSIYVLHAFQKKTQTTSKRDIDTAHRRWLELMKEEK